MSILLIQRTSIEFYPPVINQANIMAEADIPVRILDGGSGKRPSVFHPNIELIRPLAQPSTDRSDGYSKPNPRIQRISDNIQFTKALKKEQKSSDIHVRIGYDSPTIALLGFYRFSGQTIYHFHEHPEAYRPNAYLNLQHKVARYHARRDEMIVVPDKHRALALQKEEHLANMPYVVPNCPRTLKTLPTGKLRSLVCQQKPNTKYIVLFQGAISENYYADNIVRSMPWWPQEVTMVFLGPARQPIKDKLLELAQELGMADQLLFLPQVNYAQLFSYTVDADLALSMIKPVTFNFNHMAGASNKRYEFMACGIPQISNLGPGMQELIDENGVGICIDPENIESIGIHVKNLLLDEPRRKKMSQQARLLHLQQYNYDLQFAPILDYLLAIEEIA